MPSPQRWRHLPPRAEVRPDHWQQVPPPRGRASVRRRQRGLRDRRGRRRVHAQAQLPCLFRRLRRLRPAKDAAPRWRRRDPADRGAPPAGASRRVPMRRQPRAERATAPHQKGGARRRRVPPRRRSPALGRLPRATDRARRARPVSPESARQARPGSPRTDRATRSLLHGVPRAGRQAARASRHERARPRPKAQRDRRR